MAGTQSSQEDIAVLGMHNAAIIYPKLTEQHQQAMLNFFGKLVKTSAFKIITVIDWARDENHEHQFEDDGPDTKALLPSGGGYPGAPAPVELMEGPAVENRGEALRKLLTMTEVKMTEYGQGEWGQNLVRAMGEASRIEDRFYVPGGPGSERRNAWFDGEVLPENRYHAAQRCG